MKKCLSLFILTICISCNMNLNDLNKTNEIDTDLKAFLKTEDLHTSLSIGTETEDNFIHIDFVEYNFESKDHHYLDSLSSVINDRIRKKFPEVVRSKSIEIRYTTEKDVDVAKSVTSFKY